MGAVVNFVFGMMLAWYGIYYTVSFLGWLFL